MRVTFLGTGSAMPTGERMQTGLLLDAAAAEPLLVDCGSGVLHRLAATDVGYDGIEAVLLTHHHLDHVSDLMPLLKARWLAGEEAFTIAGPTGTPELVDGLLEVHAYMQDRIDLDVRVIAPGEFAIAGLDVAAMRTRHSMDCLAYRFDADGGFAFSADSEAFAELAAFADGVAAFAHDCSFPDDVEVANHPTPTRLGDVLSGHDYGTVYLTHLYPHTDGRHREMLTAIGERYDGDVRFASDGRVIEV